MNVKGSHEFEVSREKLWVYLMDPVVLAKITPGDTKLEKTDTDSYKSNSDIKIGPVKGSFKGKLKVENQQQPQSFTINMEQMSKIGNAHANIQMTLEEAGENRSSLSFNGKAKLSGVIARTGQRVLSGVASSITREVFESLEKHIEEDLQNASPPTDASTLQPEPTNTTENQITKTTESPEIQTPNSKEEPSFFKRIYQWLFGNKK